MKQIALFVTSALVLPVAVLALASSAQAEGPTWDPVTLSLSSATIEVGDSEGAIITLRALDVPPPGLGAWTITVYYDPDIVEVSQCTPLYGSACAANANNGRAFLVTGATSPGLEGDVTLAEVKFRCPWEGHMEFRLEAAPFADATYGKPKTQLYATALGSIDCIEPRNVGDVSCNERVDAIDAALILQFSAALTQTLPCQSAADVNHDSEIDPRDAALILQYAAGIIHQL